MEPIDHTEDFSEGEDFFFESDHLALRGNKDYTAVLRTICILQAQRIQASQDVDKLISIKNIALENPEEFVKKLAAGEDLNFPKAITIAELPKINFGKYHAKIPESSPDESKESSNINLQDITVRGRIFDQSKPETFNQLWTCEEQKRLEELLIEYPPEPIEMRRFAKIARALGNRTTKQVASRVQKYFKKLHLAGMPVPGRLPKSQRQYLSRTQRINKYATRLLRPSTFFPAHDVPVTMPEDDDAAGETTTVDPLFHMKLSSGANSVASFDKDLSISNSAEATVVDAESEDEETNLPGANSTDIRMIKLLQRIRKDKEKDAIDRPYSEHSDYSCNCCQEEPIIGTRWHCNTCLHESVDFCSDCFTTQLLSDKPHPILHKFTGLRVCHGQLEEMSRLPLDEETDDGEGEGEGECEDEDKLDMEINVYDKDYLPSKFSKEEEYNYLDPNFLPE